MKALFAGGIACAAASLLHILIMIGGPDWYRFFGAGEAFARAVEQGSVSAVILTMMITLILALCAYYGISGAQGNRRVPFLKTGLLLISAVFLIRGIGGVPMVLFCTDPHSNELKDRMMFMVITSLVSFGIGVCYLYGLVKIRRQNEKQGEPPAVN